jgi:hypothetical protein
MTEEIKILFLAASPVDFSPLRLDEEIREIDSKIQEGSRRDTFKLIPHFAVRWDDLHRALLRHRPHIVHFSGHGSKTEEISVMDDSGMSHPVDKESLVELFDILKNNVRIVVLNACYSKPQAEAISQIIDYTIGMNTAIGDKAAIAFAGAFYRALSFNESVRDAFRLGKNKLRGGKIAGVDTPEFICREGVNSTEPFLKQKQIIREDYADDLESALSHLASGTPGEDERQLIRDALFSGRLILQPDEAVKGRGGEGEQFHITTYKSAVHIRGDAQTLRSLQEKINPSPPGILPPSLNLIFLGREDSVGEVKRLIGIYETPQPEGSLTVVRGVPGVGKTTLVSVLSRDPEISKAFPDGVLWTSLYLGPRAEESINKVLPLMAVWGRALGADDILRAPTLGEATARMAALLREKRMLLIVDDIWDQAHAVPFLQASGRRCAVLATTRLTKVAAALTAGRGAIYRLPVLSEESALLVLRALAPSVVERHEDECRELVRDLEYLPLALHVAAGLLKAEARIGLDVSDLIDGLRKGTHLVDQEAPLDRAENGMTPTLTVLLQRSTDRLDEQTRDCFAFLGAFAPKPASFDLAAMSAVWQVPDPKPIVRNLVGHGLLEPVSNQRFQMHALLVQHARSLLTD